MQQAYVNAYFASAAVRWTGQILDLADENRRPRGAGVARESAAVTRRSISQKRRTRSWSGSHHPIRNTSAFAGELRSLLESSIDELPDGLREVFMLREVDGLNTAETAECLGVSEDVVKTRLSRSRARACATSWPSAQASWRRRPSVSRSRAATGLLPPFSPGSADLRSPIDPACPRDILNASRFPGSPYL